MDTRAEPLRVLQLIAVLRWRDMVIDPECFAEIVAGCCLHTVSACTKVDGIQVILKDYIFIIDLLLNLNGKVLLLKLTRKSFNLGGLVGPVGENIVLQKLLGNGTCTL